MVTAKPMLFLIKSEKFHDWNIKLIGNLFEGFDTRVTVAPLDLGDVASIQTGVDAKAFLGNVLFFPQLTEAISDFFGYIGHSMRQSKKKP